MFRFSFMLCIAWLVVGCRADKNSVEPIPVRILSVVPDHGPVGDQVRITGEGFNTRAEANLVSFNGSVAVIVSATATELFVIVPADATSGKISVGAMGITTQSATAFTVDVPDTMATPVIHSVFPEHAAEGETVIITGENFSGFKNENEIRVGGGIVTLADFAEAGPTHLKIKVPPTAENGLISVKVKNHEALSANAFKVDFSLIGFFPKQGLPGTVVTINGKRFPPDVEVFFGSQKINTLQRLPHSVLAVIGGPESGRLTIRSGNLSKETDELFHTRNIWLEVSGPSWGVDGLTEKGVSFVSGQEIWNGFGQSSRFMVFDPVRRAWTTGVPHPAALASRKSAISYSSNGKLFLGQGSGEDFVNDWWQFDPPNQQWKQFTRLPVNAQAGVAFAVAGEGFAGLGPAQHLYAFDGNDPGTWSIVHLSVAPGPALQTAFVIGNNAYFGGGVSTSGSFARFFYKYDGNSRQVSRISNIPANTVSTSGGRAASYVLDGKGYVIAGGTSLFVYEPSTDQWIFKKNAPDISFAEVIGGKVYGWNADGTMYQYIP